MEHKKTVWLLTTGTGTDGDEWYVESIHETQAGAEIAKAKFQQPNKRPDGSEYIRDANIEEWSLEELPHNHCS